MSANLPDAEFSLREGYLPSWRSAEFVELGRPAGRAETSAARALAIDAGLKVIS